MKKLAYAFIGINTIDAISTAVLVTFDFVEFNPIMAHALELNIWFFVAVKILVGTLVAVLAYRVNALLALILGFILLSVVSINNVLGLLLFSLNIQ